MTHLDALQIKLSNERIRLADAKSASEVTLRKIWIEQLEKEIAGEKAFVAELEKSDDELLEELGF